MIFILLEVHPIFVMSEIQQNSFKQWKYIKKVDLEELK